jgi:hypothetical protein
LLSKSLINIINDILLGRLNDRVNYKSSYGR